MTTTIKKLVEHVRVNTRCGLHSGFRPCCIAWWLGPWQLIYRHTPRLQRAYFGVIDGLHGRIQYVCCPMCLLLDRKPVPVMKCVGPYGECVATGEKVETTRVRMTLVK